MTAIYGALTWVLGTVLGAEGITGKGRVSLRGACTPSGKAGNKYTSKLVKITSGAGKCEEQVKQGGVGLRNEWGVRVMFLPGL